MATSESTRGELIDKVVKIRRCAAVVKGGRRFSFAALVVIGDGKGKVGWGYGKVNEVPPSVEGHLLDPRLQRFLRDRLAQDRRRLAVPPVADLLAELRVHRAGGNQRAALSVVDNLGRNVFVAAENAQPRPARISLDAVADSKPAPEALAADSLFVFHVFVSLVVGRASGVVGVRGATT